MWDRTRSRDAIRALFARCAFPVVMVSAVAAAIHLMGRGVSPLLALLYTQIPAYLFVVVCERLLPHQRDWNRSRGDLATDAAHSLTIALTGGLLQPLILVGGVALAAWLSSRLGLGLWPESWPLAAQLALALLVGEFFEYWVHRLQHERPWLWRFHATHHSAPRLYWLNAGRFHPVDFGMNYAASHVPLVALGAGAEVLALWGLFAAIHGIFQHANLPTRIGPLNWIFSMAELHRWHHSPLVDESNRNYGQNLIVWDVVFGTRFLPRDREPPPDVGIADLPAFPMTYFAQLAAPFRWSKIAGAA